MTKRPAFTLVELTIVVAILAILAALVLPRFADATQDATEAAAQTNLAILQGQIDAYHAEHGDYPDDLKSEWFIGGSLPANPMADFQTATVVEVKESGNPAQTDPADKTTDQASTAPWWYDADTGQVRARVKTQRTIAQTLRLYNRVNGVTATSLSDTAAQRIAARDR